MITATIDRISTGWIHAAAAAAFLVASAPNVALMAQGLEADGAIDAIVGSDVTTGEEAVTADEARIVAAIERTTENAAEVRKRFALNSLEIVFLPDLDEKTTTIDEKLVEYEPQIEELRTEIQGSALFYHAVDSRSVLLTDIIAIEFDDADNATIFVAGQDPEN
ncbi:hypothetical protein [Mesorhizobium sp. CAU 1741]|uniref:hypothetical protein n=1 Tax=Mesorhizobium sp. CAU 1741 TaxID=3140366 RepID=UPI00325B2831